LQRPSLECPNCRQAYAAGSSGNCPTCVVPLVYLPGDDLANSAVGAVYRPAVPTDYLRCLARANQLNKVWLAASLLYALGHLMMLRGANPVWIAAFLAPPLLAFATLCSSSTNARVRRLAWVYLAALVVGDLLAPYTQILPRMNLFAQLPLAVGRLLTWQLALSSIYLFLVLPPVYLGGRLRHAIRRRRVGIGVVASLRGFSIWIVLLPALLLGILLGFRLL
jgi:hypothetical protein